MPRKFMPHWPTKASGRRGGSGHFPGARAWASTWFNLNRNWDGRVLLVGNLALMCLGLCALWQRCGNGFDQVASRPRAGIIALVWLIPIGPRQSLEAVWSGGLVALSLCIWSDGEDQIGPWSSRSVLASERSTFSRPPPELRRPQHS